MFCRSVAIFFRVYIMSNVFVDNNVLFTRVFTPKCPIVVSLMDIDASYLPDVDCVYSEGSMAIFGSNCQQCTIRSDGFGNAMARSIRGNRYIRIRIYLCYLSVLTDNIMKWILLRHIGHKSTWEDFTLDASAEFVIESRHRRTNIFNRLLMVLKSVPLTSGYLLMES